MSQKSKRAHHTSLPGDLDRSIRWLEKFPEVQKVILGFIKSCGHSYPPGHIRIQGECLGGLKAVGYFGSGLVNFVITISGENAYRVKREVEKKFS